MAISIFVLFYSWLLRLYPSPFRDEFGAEMEIVFQEQMEDAAAFGHVHLLRACWREVRDLPYRCLQTHWQLRQQRLGVATSTPPSWWDTAAAGLPYFLFALIVSGSSLVFLFGQATGVFVGLLFGYGFLFLLMLVLIAAWWRGWPVWSAAWLGFLFFFLLVLFVPRQLFDILGQSPQMQSVQIVVSEVVLPLLWLAVLYVLLARWPRAGLVALLPTFGIPWLLYLDSVPESVSLVVTAVTWLWLGIVAIVLLRWRYHKWDVWLLYLAAAVVGLIFIYAAHYLTEKPLRDGSIAGMGEDLLSELIPVLIPLIGILLLLTMRWWSRVNGRAAVHSYHLLLTGVVLATFGLQTRLMMTRKVNFSWPEYQRFWVTAAVLLGFLLMAASIWLLVRKRRQWSFAINWRLWLLIGLLLLPPIIVNVRWLTMAFGRGLLWQLSLPASILWLVLAAWLYGAVRQQLPPVPAKRKKVRAKSAMQPANATISGRIGSMTGWQLFILIPALLLLVALLLPSTTLANLFPNSQSQPFDLPTSFPLFMFMTAGLIMAAVLLASGFNLLQSGAKRAAVFFFSLSFLMLVASLRNYYWLAIWDSTYDGLGFLWLFIPILGIFLATLGLVVILPRTAKLAACFYLLLLPPALLTVTQLASQVDYFDLTEIRAARVDQTLNAYYGQEGHYPDSLQLLAPRHLRSLSEPMIIFGQDWCYASDGDQYQFGYVYREHWSNPNLVGLVYSGINAVQGESTLPSLCQAEIARLQARDPTYYSLRNE